MQVIECANYDRLGWAVRRLTATHEIIDLHEYICLVYFDV